MGAHPRLHAQHISGTLQKADHEQGTSVQLKADDGGCGGDFSRDDDSYCVSWTITNVMSLTFIERILLIAVIALV